MYPLRAKEELNEEAARYTGLPRRKDFPHK